MQPRVPSAWRVAHAPEQRLILSEPLYSNKTGKTFKNEQRSKDAAAKKDLIQVE